MDKKLSLVVLRNKKVVAFAELGSSTESIGRMIPKREPQHKTEYSDFWVVDTVKRGALVKHVDSVYDDYKSYNGPSFAPLYGWFGMVGIARRFLRDTGVVWGLYLSTNGVDIGQSLRA